MCLEALFGGGDKEDKFVEPAPLPVIQRSTPVVAENTQALIRIGSDAARARNTRVSGGASRKKVAGVAATTGLSI